MSGGMSGEKCPGGNVRIPINHVSVFKMKPKLFQQPACSGNLIHFNTFHAVVAATNEDIDTQNLEGLDHSFNCHF